MNRLIDMQKENLKAEFVKELEGLIKTTVEPFSYLVGGELRDPRIGFLGEEAVCRACDIVSHEGSRRLGPFADCFSLKEISARLCACVEISLYEFFATKNPFMDLAPSFCNRRQEIEDLLRSKAQKYA